MSGKRCAQALLGHFFSSFTTIKIRFCQALKAVFVRELGNIQPADRGRKTRHKIRKSVTPKTSTNPPSKTPFLPCPLLSAQPFGCFSNPPSQARAPLHTKSAQDRKLPSFQNIVCFFETNAKLWTTKQGLCLRLFESAHFLPFSMHDQSEHIFSQNPENKAAIHC